MANWQRKARITIAIGGVAFAVALAFAFRERVGVDDLRAFGHRSRAKQQGFAREDWEGKPVIADNMYLSMLVETGIIGLAAMLLFNVTFAVVLSVMASIPCARSGRRGLRQDQGT